MYRRILTLLCIGSMIATNTHAQDQQLDTIPGTPSADSLIPDSLENAGKFQNRIINTAFSSTRRSFITGAVTDISPDELLKFDNVHTVADMIMGRVPGSFGGLDLRGLGPALIVIDGFPRPIASVNINEVEQITVLKDASAALLYGVQAKNGVIIITTKKGQANKKVIRANLEYGVSEPISYPNYLGAADYMELYNEALANDGLNSLYSSEAIAGTRSGTNPVKYPDAEYYNSKFLKSYKPFSRIVTEFSGGNQNAQYYVNMGWLRSGSILNMGEGKDQHTDRLNMRSNLNFRLSKAIQSALSIVGIFDINRTANGNFFNSASTLNPNVFPMLIPLSMVTDNNIRKTAQTIDGNILGGTSVYKNNVYGNLNFGGYRNQMNTSVQFNNSYNVDLGSLVKGLRFRANIGIDFYNQFVETQINTYAVYEPGWNVVNSQQVLSLKKIGIDKFSGTQGIDSTNMKRRTNLSAMLDYSTQLGPKSDLDASLIYYFDQFRETDVFQSDKHAHGGARVAYSYNKRYLIDLGAAIVYSPKLPDNNRIGFSPSVGLGWILSEEQFMKNSSFIDFFKLRASASVMNTDMSLTRYYAYENIFGYGSLYTWGDGTRLNNASVQSTTENMDLFYEKRNELNFGADLVMFNKSLSLDINVFFGKRSDQILIRNNTYPGYLGGLNPLENYGEDSYNGAELGITWRKSLNDLNIEIGANMVYATTNVIQRDEIYANDYLYRAGRPVAALYGLEALGLFRDAADIANSPAQSFGTVQPGDIKYKDQNGDNKIDGNDELMIGNEAPELSGGLTFKLEYKGLSLFALGTGSYGSDRYYSNAYYQVYGDRKFSEVVWNRWTPATASTATYPRLTSRANNNNFRNSSYWLYNNSFVNIARVQLGYELPSKLASVLKTKSISIFVRASNLATFSKNKEQMELNIGTEPQYRYYSGGLKANF